MKKQMFQFLAVFLTLLLLAGCAGTPAAPSEDSTVPPATEPTELVFNGKSYPLDVESLEIGTYDLEQLRWAANLRELVISGSAPESWEFLSTLSALETLTIHLSGTEAADVRLDGALLPALKTLEISTDSPIETLALPQAGLESCRLTLPELRRLDLSAAAVETLLLSLPGAPDETVPGRVQSLECEDFSPDDALLGLDGLESLSLNVLQPLDFLSGLPQIKKLSLSGGTWELSPLVQSGVTELSLYKVEADLKALAQSGLETLRLQECAVEPAALAGMAHLRVLQLSDEGLTTLPLEELPELETLILQVSPEQLQATFTAENAAELEQLDTGLSKEALAAFLERGGTIYTFPDHRRN